MMYLLRRISRSLQYRLFEKDYVPYFARSEFQNIALKLLNFLLRVIGFNNYGPASKSGEEYFLECFVKTEPVFCIDVGANIGRYSEFILNNSASSILAFEPLPAAYSRLEALQQRFPSRLTIENMGCSEKSGSLDLHFGSEISELASFSTEVLAIDYVGESNKNTIRVKTTSLDDFWNFKFNGEIIRCDLLKIDTEGFEYEVLVGAANLISIVRPRIIQIEFNLHHLYRGHSLKLLGDLLTDYKLFRILPHKNGLTPCSSDSFVSNIYQFSNYIFVSNEYCSNFNYKKALGI